MSVCLDRFSQGLRDPAEAEVKTHCDHCHGDIFAGHEVFVMNGVDIIHRNCLSGYVSERQEVMTVEEAMER